MLGDVGIHIFDFVGYGAVTEIDHVFARMKAFEKAPGNKIGEYDLDANDSFTMTAEFTNGAMGVIHASRWATGHLNELRLRVHGDKGALEVIHRLDGSRPRACLQEDVEKAVWREIEVDPVQTNYQKFIAAIQSGYTQEPSFRHAANLQKILDLAMLTEVERRELAV